MLAPSPACAARGRRVAVAALVASSIEWYGFFIYATASALIFGKVFFPTVSPVAATLASSVTFGAGFAARPLGGAVFGHLTDLLGRKPALVSSLVLMAGATTLIGLLPGFPSIGVFAPFALVLLRICQGMAIGGGQWGVLAAESVPRGKRGRYVQLGVPIGMVLGTSVFLIVATVVSPTQFEEWGWRVPFLLSAVTGLFAYYIHRRIDDVPEVRVPGSHRPPILAVVRRHRMAVLFASSVYVVLSAAFYVLTAGLLDYGTRTLGISRSSMLLAVLIGVSSMVLTLPLSAALADRIGRKPVFGTGAVATGASIFLVFPLVETLDLGLITLGLVIAMTTIAMMYGPQAALFAEMFPPRSRYSGASLGCQIANVIGGGLAPFIMVLLLESTGSSISVAIYVAVLAMVALGALSFAAETRVPDVDAEPSTVAQHRRQAPEVRRLPIRH